MKTRLIKFLILSGLILIFSKPTFGQTINETITITTYYPSPHGVYGILRLYPRSTQPEEDISFEGDLYYDDGTTDPDNRTKGVYVFNGTKWTLTSIGGGGGGGGTVPIKLATPLQEQVGEPLQIPPASGTYSADFNYDSDESVGPWTQIGSYSFNADRSGIQADIKQLVHFDNTYSFGTSVCGNFDYHCHCCSARMIFDGKIVDEGLAYDSNPSYRTAELKYTSPVLSMGQHSVSFEFRPKRCAANLSSCSCTIAEIRQGSITLSRSISEIIVPDSAYK
jgi:hypothetical protein